MIYLNYSQFYKLRLPEGHDYYDVEDFNSNTQTIDGELNKLKNMIGQGGSASEQIVNVLATGWVEGQQTVSLTGVTSSSIIIMGMATGATSEQVDTILIAKINALSVGNGTVTLVAYGETPAIDVPLSFVIMK